jgi:glycosyltransferase involved in cell wall biosynthesis
MFFFTFTKITLYWCIYWIGLPVYVLVLCLFAAFVGIRLKPKTRPRIVWGSVPIINNSYWSQALRQAGYFSETYTSMYYSNIHRRSDWDRIIDEEYRGFPKILKPFIAFPFSLLRYDLFVVPFSGYFIGDYPVLWRLQSLIFRLARKKVIVIPYGADAFVYKRINSTAMIHALLTSYPDAARNQKRIEDWVDYWCEKADCVISPNLDGFGRWDVLLHSTLSIDLDNWPKTNRMSNSNGTSGEPVVVVHAPNHRGFKGTEFIVEAVKTLSEEGLKVELILLENQKNSSIREALYARADILVEQLIYPGYTMNGIEGMACGVTVVDNLEDDERLVTVRRWSYFAECPVVSASPETIVNVLRKLVTRPLLRSELGTAGREYVQKYHGLDSAQYLFENVIEYVYKRRASLIDLYHPLIGDYPRRLPKVEHSLVNNRIVD